MKTKLPWIRKHEPKTSSEVLGQEKAINDIKNFVQNFKKEKKNALILNGPTGSGKTASVYAVANDLNLEVVEVNASDVRNKDGINSVIGNATKQMSLFSKGKIILVDEIDGISGRKDRGGVTALAKIAKESSFPMILCSNDCSDKKLNAIRKVSKIIEFSELDFDSILYILKKICEKENIKFDEKALKQVARMAGGDARAAINDLQIAAAGGSVNEEDLDVLSYRNRTRDINEILTLIFKTSDSNMAVNAMNELDMNYDDFIMWIDQNLPDEYKDAKSRARAFEVLSKADIFRRKIRRRQHWRFLVYIKALLSAGIAVSKEKKNPNIINYVRSKRPLTYWIMNRKNKYRDSVAEKIAEKLHISFKSSVKNAVPSFKEIYKSDAGFRESADEDLELDEKEKEWLLK